MRGSFPLVGRQEELQFIKDALLESGTRGVILAGAAGVGKTRLAWEALSDAAFKGFSTHWVAATRSASTIPFGAIAALLPEPTRQTTDLLDVLRQGIRALSEDSSRARVVVAIDDAHLLDDPSAVFVHQIALSQVAFLIATIRTGEPIPDSLAALWKEGLVERFEVQTLSENEIQALVGEVLGGQVGGATLFELWRASNGNPLLVRELVLGGLDSGYLAETGGIWRWAGPLAAGPRLLEVIESRLGRLDADERRVLEVLALGEPLGPEVLEKLVSMEALERVEQKGLVEVRKDERRMVVQLSHPLYGDALRVTMPTFRTRNLMRSLAEALGATGTNRRDDVLRIATWCLEAGAATNPRILTNAAFHAIGAFDYVLAEKLARAALECGGGFDSMFALGDALRSQARPEDAEQVLAGLGAAAKDDEERTAAAVLRAYNLFFGKDDLEAAQRVIRETEGEVSDERALSLARAQRAIFSLYAGDPLEAIEAAQRVFDAPDSSEHALMEAALAGATALAIAGRVGKAEGVLERGQSVVSRLPVEEASYIGQLLAVQFLIHWLAGRLGEADATAEMTYSLAVAQKSHDGMALMLVALGRVALGQGRVETAADRFKEASVLLREVDRNRFLPWSLASLAHAQALRGNLEEANRVLEEAGATHPRSVRLFAVEFEIGRAWVAAAHGEVSKSREILEEAARDAAATGQLVFECEALHDLARLGYPEEAKDRLWEIANATEAIYAPAFAAHAQALIENDGGGLDEVAAAFEKQGAYLLAAEAAAEATHAHRNAGRAGSALASAARSRELAGLCQGAHTPSLRLADVTSPLTRREKEVAALAAGGLSSREIADRLVISVRTVDNHLQRAYSKLGVGGRKELATAVGSNEQG